MCVDAASTVFYSTNSLALNVFDTCSGDQIMTLDNNNNNIYFKSNIPCKLSGLQTSEHMYLNNQT